MVFWKGYRNLEIIETEELQEIYRLIIGGEPKKGTRPNRFNEDLERAENFWNKMIKWKYKNVAVVCHGSIIRFFISKAIEASPKHFHNIDIYPASISIIKIDKNKSKVVLINDISHLPKELITSDSIYVEWLYEFYHDLIT